MSGAGAPGRATRVSGRLGLIVGVILLLVTGPGAEPAATWRHGLVRSKADAGFFWMALEKGFFAQRGLAVRLVEFRGDHDVLRALLTRNLDSAELSPTGPLIAMAAGADLRFIGSSMPGLPFALYVHPGIAGWPDLAGRTLAVSAPGSTPDIIARAMLARNGVDPRSIRSVNAGGSADRIRALVAGRVDATASSSEFVVDADRLGIKVLARAADVVPEFPRFVIVATVGTLTARRADVVGFLAAYMEGLDYALQHKDDTLRLAAKLNDKPVTDPQLAAMYDEVRARGYVSTTSEIPRAKIEWLQNELLQLGVLQARVDLDRHIDESYRKDALTRAHRPPGR